MAVSNIVVTPTHADQAEGAQKKTRQTAGSPVIDRSRTKKRVSPNSRDGWEGYCMRFTELTTTVGLSLTLAACSTETAGPDTGVVQDEVSSRGEFVMVNAALPSFQTWASQTKAVVTGDFNGDGKTDIAAVGADGWNALPAALSNGDGSFRLVNQPIDSFQTWASQPRRS